jgi:hypothetical protein
MYGARGEMYTGFCWFYLKERDPLEDQGVGERKILRGIITKWDGGLRLDVSGSG